MRILLITGWGFTEKIWYPVEQQFNENWEVEKLDFLGQDLAEANNLEYREILKNEIINTRPDVAAGWSMGAIILLEALIQFDLPGFLTVLLSGTPRFVQPDDTSPAGVSPIRLRAMRRGLSREPGKTLRQFYDLVKQPNSKISRKGRLKNINDKYKLLKKGLNYLRKVDLTDSLAKIDRPLELIHGRKDEVIPYSAGQYLEENLIQCRLVELGGGHLSVFRQPEALNKIIYKHGVS